MDMLLVEDEALIALHLAEQIGSLGHRTKAIAYNVHAALDLARNVRFDAAVLDYRLHDLLTSEVVACELRRRGVPILWHTGDDPGCRRADEPLVHKPSSTEALRSALERLHRH